MSSETTQAPFSAIIVGSTGGIGAALAQLLHNHPALVDLHLINRRLDTQAANLGKATAYVADPMDESGFADTIASIEPGHDAPLRLVICAIGTLHLANGTGPEKTLRDLTADNLSELFQTNAVAPALVAKHTVPLLPRAGKSVIALLSARVGSISDNRLGGWYSYRMAKAALNQIIKTTAVELTRRKPEAAIIGLHPGTVDTRLSRPFQDHVADGKLFSPAQSAGYLLQVIDQVTAQDSGHVLAWDGSQVPA